MKNVLKPLAKSALIPPDLTTAASAIDSGTQKKSSWIRDDNINNFK